MAQVRYWKVSYTDMIKTEDSLPRKSKNFLVKDGLLYYPRSNVNLQVHVRVDSDLVLTQLSTRQQVAQVLYWEASY